MPVKRLADFDLKADAPGHLEATFSRFDVVDHDGDVTRRSAFTDGQRVPLVWAHNWDQPIGDGVVRVERDRAVFAGQFWMDVADGEQAYKKVKRAGDLQDYSYGFRIREAEPGVHDGQPVRVLKSLEVFEVSPVLVGAGIGTGTDRIKQADPAGPVETFLAQVERLLADLGAVRDRSRAVAALRATEGRGLSKAQRAALTALLEAHAAVRGDLAGLIRPDPRPSGSPDLEALAAGFARLRTRLGGT